MWVYEHNIIYHFRIFVDDVVVKDFNSTVDYAEDVFHNFKELEENQGKDVKMFLITGEDPRFDD